MDGLSYEQIRLILDTHNYYSNVSCYISIDGMVERIEEVRVTPNSIVFMGAGERVNLIE